jgi:hypothetical protein
VADVRWRIANSRTIRWVNVDVRERSRQVLNSIERQDKRERERERSESGRGTVSVCVCVWLERPPITGRGGRRNAGTGAA